MNPCQHPKEVLILLLYRPEGTIMKVTQSSIAFASSSGVLINRYWTRCMISKLLELGQRPLNQQLCCSSQDQSEESKLLSNNGSS